MAVKVLIIGSGKDADETVEMEMPGPPFLGLHVRVPWRGGDYHKITHICWDDVKGRYEAFVD